MEEVLNVFISFIKPASVVIILTSLLIINRLVFKKSKFLPSEGGIAKGAISITLVLVGIVAFILVLPIDKALKGQVLSFLGIITSAGIALSSTTLLGNLIGGIMNNSMKRFRNGDLITVADFQGRVIRKNILHTEIQLQDSNFITLPNLFIASNPVKLIRKTNSVISTSVSLGYDISRVKIEETLKEAAAAAGLSDPYVYITGLGDYSVVYKIHGFLDDSDTYFSTTSLLNAKVMDKLHEAKIEIVSPTFMNQRRVDEQQFIPEEIKRKVRRKAKKSPETNPEQLVFDKAIKSGKLETKKDFLASVIKKQETLKNELKSVKGTEETDRIKSAIKNNENLQSRIENNIREQLEKESKQRGK